VTVQRGKPGTERDLMLGLQLRQSFIVILKGGVRLRVVQTEGNEGVKVRGINQLVRWVGGVGGLVASFRTFNALTD
jgi:hypothetical protein